MPVKLYCLHPNQPMMMKYDAQKGLKGAKINIHKLNQKKWIFQINFNCKDISIIVNDLG